MGEAFARTEALLGAAGLRRLAKAKVLVVGVGGVGSWCAEALVRTGVGSITLIDDDTVAESNLNRQDPALAATVGVVKVEAMKARLDAIGTGCAVRAIRARYPEVEGLELSEFDAVVDAIDSVDAKAALILSATESGKTLVSSMGAALRTDPTRVKATRFEKVEGDGLAKALRGRFKKLGRFPGRFTAVWSDEPAMKSEVRGSLMQVTATFGMALAAETVKALVKE